ncbi:uncharacterized protein RHOBADRAFT_40683 [Rhodotorula graminis WP1]|uniref:Uncharacterized protein n=1 Tax=Rhodotorula graminis (strain WP1) TaxID=578459 RepID=A0A194SC16_RHOGW|nr:uncharacterized protein RHOBADRAFT_40683 [Rhodotorula graminis WP1]KPV78139.1 hypothetical protein RHOBADRAFT_40683 [Rhodotorula graminis WP1]
MIGARVGLRSAQVVSGRRFASTAQPAGLKKTLFQTWYEPAAIPIWVVVGTACFGAGWYLTRLARGADVTWDRRGNPEPWNNIKPGTLTKMYTNQPDKFDSVYSRDRL